MNAEDIVDAKTFIEAMRYALGRFDWGKSALDAESIGILNEWEIKFGEILKGERDAGRDEERRLWEDAAKVWCFECGGTRDLADKILGIIRKKHIESEADLAVPRICAQLSEIEAVCEKETAKAEKHPVAAQDVPKEPGNSEEHRAVLPAADISDDLKFAAKKMWERKKEETAKAASKEDKESGSGPSPRKRFNLGEPSATDEAKGNLPAADIPKRCQVTDCKNEAWGYLITNGHRKVYFCLAHPPMRGERIR